MKSYKPTHSLVIIQRILPHYRVSFFEALNDRLSELGIKLLVIYGHEKEGTVPQTVNGDFIWGRKVAIKYMSAFGRTFYSMNIKRADLDCDLVVFEHAMSFLTFYFLYFSLPPAKVALWGHGQNLQNRKKIFWKDFFLKRADWWFGYTKLTEGILKEKGYDEGRVTIVNNTIDTAIFNLDSDLLEDEQESLLRQLSIEGENICVYCGGIYSHKKIDFLLTVAELLSVRIKDFSLIVIGGGPEQYKVEKASQINSRIKFVGPLYDRERIPYLKMAKTLLMPGLVGLAIVDSFAARTPIITTDIPIHSPEIEYLEHEVNGLIVEHDVESYANAVQNYLESKERQVVLEAGCAKSADLYSIDNMVERFSEGVVKCINAGG